MERWAGETSLAITLGALIGSTIWFGATSPAALAVAEAAIFTAALLLLVGRPDLLSGRHRTPLDLPVAAFALMPLLQLVPLPARLIGLLAPGLEAIRGSLGVEPASFLPLSAYPYATLQALNRTVAAALVFFVITRVVTSAGRLRRTLLALVWLGAAEAAYGLIGYLIDSPTILAGHPQYYRGSATGTLVCKNHFAGLMEMLLPIALAYYWAFPPPPSKPDLHEQTARRALGLVAPALMALALIFSRSRAGIACLVFAGMVMLALTRHGRQRHYNRVALASLAALILIYGSAIGFDPVIERFQDLDTRYALARAEIWRDGLQLALFSPLLGTGAGTWASMFPVVKTMPVQITFSHAHNDYVQALAEGGIIGLALLAWLLSRALAETRAALHQRRHHPKSLIFPIALATGILSIALHGLVDFNLQIPSNLFLFMTLLALLSLTARKQYAIAPRAKPRLGAERLTGRETRRGCEPADSRARRFHRFSSRRR